MVQACTSNGGIHFDLDFGYGCARDQFPLKTAILAAHGDKCSRRVLVVVFGGDPGSASERCT